MEGVQFRSQEIARPRNLSPAQRKMILGHRQEIYKIDGADVDAICDLRGLDVPSHFTGLKMKYACIVATSKGMKTPHTFIGPSDDARERAAEDDIAGDDPEPVSIEKVSVRFNFVMPAPNFEISTGVSGTHEESSDDMATTRIYAEDRAIKLAEHRPMR